MAVQISDGCISCGACQAECPLGALSEGQEIFEVDSGRCVECVGLSGELSCMAVCPTRAITLNEGTSSESEDVLLALAHQLLPDRELPALEALDESKSHFRRMRRQEGEKRGDETTVQRDSSLGSAMAMALNASGATSSLAATVGGHSAKGDA